MKHHLSILLLCAALPLAAETNPAKPATPPPAAAAVTFPKISELYQVKLENVNLRAQMLQQQFESSPQMVQLRAQYAALVSEIQKAYPGYRWDGHELVKTAPPPPTPAAKPPAKH